MPKRPVDYDKLRILWYKKLKDSGFEDIEQDDFNLKEWSTLNNRRHTTTIEIVQAITAYYDMARRFLGEYTFETTLDAIIWEYHSEGITTRNIAKTLSKVRKKKIGNTKVWQIVCRLEHIMKLKYLPWYREEHE